MDDQQVPPPDEPVPPVSGEGGSETAPEAAPVAVDAAPTEAPPEGPTSQWIQPTSSGRSSRVLPVLLAVLVIGVVGIVAALMVIGANADPREAATRDFGQRLIEMPEFKERYGDVDTPEEAYELGQTVGARAFARLDDPSLLRYWQLTEVLIRNADDATCTRIMRQTIEPADAEELAKTLDEDDYVELLDISFRAFEAELKDTPGPPTPNDADVQAASLALANAMGVDQVTQAATALQDPTAADAAVCGAARSFLSGVLQLEEPHRATFLRYMATP
jgi:hypothetical protein